MIFSKLKPKSDELLPPPPPFPSMELEEEKHDISEARPKAKPHKDEELECLFKEVESLKAKSPKKAPKPKVKAAKELKKPAIKKEQKKLPKNIALPKAKSLKKPKTAAKLPKPASGKAKKEKLDDLDFILPKEMPEDFDIAGIEKQEEIEMPDSLEDLDIDKEFGADLGQELGAEHVLNEARPREIEEAEDEIKSAIEKIKQTERPSMLKRIFGKKEAQEKQPAPEVQNDVSSIQSRLNSARDALMRFDLEAAKRNYIEIMKIYNKIKPEEQAKVYHDVKDLYFERKSAEEMKV